MKIFVSHSLKDKDLLRAIQENLGRHVFQLLIAEHLLSFDLIISDKIKALIQQCDDGLILLTENGLNSKFVSEEIGFLEAKGKPIIRAIQKGLSNQNSGFKYGTDFIELDPDDPSSAHQKLESEMLTFRNEKISSRNAWIFKTGVLLLLISSQSEED